jgi:hypothetical protein
VPVHEREAAGFPLQHGCRVDNADGNSPRGTAKNHIPHTTGISEKFF